MKWIIENWYILVALIAVLVIAGLAIYHFIKLPISDKWKKVSVWLLSAVTEAEKALGSQTGQLKLSMVYDMFITKFPFISSIMSFTTFSKLVDAALVKMRDMLENNEAIKNYVEG